METQLVTKEAFSKNHTCIRDNLLTRVRDLLSEPDLKLVSISTETGYKSFHESIDVTRPGYSLRLTLTTETDTQ